MKGTTLRYMIGCVNLRQERRLDQLHFAWNVDQQTAMWHHLLHEARRFKACPDSEAKEHQPCIR